MSDVVRSLFGMGILVLIGFFVSYNRGAIRWRTVLAALAVQIAIGAFVLFVPIGIDISWRHCEWRHACPCIWE